MMSVATADELRTQARLSGVVATHPQYLRTTPNVLSEPVRELAAQIVADSGAENNYDKAKAIERWLRGNITYNQMIPDPPEGVDPLDWFLFDLKQGYCNYYATAMVVMLRSQNIPARMAGGFSQGAFDAQSGQYVVKESDAHTWVEAYFPGFGWIEFEPTSNQEPLNREGDDAFSDNMFNPGQTSPTDTPTPTSTPTLEPSVTPTPPIVDESPTPTLMSDQLPENTTVPPTATPTPTVTPTQTPVILPTAPAPVAPEPRSVLDLLLPALGLVLLIVLVLLLVIAALWMLYWWWEWRGMRGLSPITRAYARLERYLGLVGIHFQPQLTPEERRRETMRELPGAERPVTSITRLYAAERYGPADRGSSEEARDQADAAWERSAAQHPAPAGGVSSCSGGETDAIYAGSLNSCLEARPHRYFERIRSTMDAAREWLLTDAPHGAIVITGEQTAGRGRMGRSWLTPDGSALTMSVILRPANGNALPQVSMMGGLAVLDALASLGLRDLFLKWPNDLLVGDKKVCGVLVETAWEGVYLRGASLGIGLNVSGGFDNPEIAAIATTVAEALGHPVGAAVVLRAVIDRLESRLPDLDTPVMFDAWRSRLGTIGQRVRVEGSSAFEGVAEDVNMTGALLVRADGGQLRTVLAGDVRVRPAQR